MGTSLLVPDVIHMITGFRTHESGMNAMVKCTRSMLEANAWEM